MKAAVTGLVLAMLATAPLAHAATPTSPKAVAAAAVADPSRPADDRARDADRKPAAMLEFAGVRPGMTVIDAIPGGGYFTRLFSAAVGPTGTVYAYVPDEMLKKGSGPLDRLAAIAASNSNVKVEHNPLLQPGPANVADVVWTSQNYHDLHNMAGVDVVEFDRQVLRTLKPGGVFVVLDHAAKAGSGLADTNTTHRIDPNIVRQELVAAGFVYDGESKVLANASDDHTLKVFDPALRGKTDQFAYRFRKPGGARR